MTDDAHRRIVDGMAVAQGQINAMIASAGTVPDAGGLAKLRRIVVHPRGNDCGCTADVVCRQNGNYPRRNVHEHRS